MNMMIPNSCYTQNYPPANNYKTKYRVHNPIGKATRTPGIMINKELNSSMDIQKISQMFFIVID